MKELIQTLLEDYKRRLQTINVMAAGLPRHADTVDSHKRYTIKASCYRTFISELQSILDKENIKTDY